MAQKGNRVLILDFNDEYGEYGIKSIAVEHVPVFMVHPVAEIRRIRPFYMTTGGTWAPMRPTDMISTLEKVIGIYKGGALVIEDPNKYMVDSVMPPDFTGKLISKRHSDLDIMMHYQSVGRPLPIVWQNTNIIRYHCQNDPVIRSKSKLTDMIDVFQIAELIVNHQYYKKKNPRFFVYISKDTGTIIGNFTYDMFNLALDEFIMFNPATLRPYQTRYLMQGVSKTEAYSKALVDCKKDLFDKYWGNNTDFDPNKKREALTMICTGRQGVGKTWETMRYLREDYCGKAA